MERPGDRPAQVGERSWVLLAGGGTAGHVNPGLGIADELVERGVPSELIHFVGSSRGVEAEQVPAAGYGLTLLPGRGVQRKLTVENVSAIAGIARACATAMRLVRARRPSVVVALGGYASVPCALAAAALRVPLIVAEQNAVPGVANRLTSRFARVSAVSFPDTPLPRSVVTGNPLRSSVLDVDPLTDGPRARRELGLPEDRTVVLVFGGSLGARRINDAVLELVESWADRDDLAIRHVIGARDWDELGDRPPPDGPLVYQQVRYEDRMPLALAATDLAVCRAGATTVAELAALGLPALFVPYPWATGDHQTANARFFTDRDAGLLIPDDELTADRLRQELGDFLADDHLRATMAERVRFLATPDAASRVADLVERHARTPAPMFGRPAPHDGGPREREGNTDG